MQDVSTKVGNARCMFKIGYLQVDASGQAVAMIFGSSPGPRGRGGAFGGG